MAVGGGIQTLGGLLGYLLSLPDRDQAMQIIQSAMDDAGNIDVPTLSQLVQTLGPSEAGAVTSDPRLGAAQDQSLAALQNVASSGGLTASDKAVLNRTTNKAARVGASANADIINSMRARGVGGSGAEFAMRQANAASAADRANQSGLDVAGMAQDRALNAMIQGGNLAGDMRRQGFDEKFRAAQARDMINEYNARARAAGVRDRFGMGMDKLGMKNQARGAQATALNNRASATQAMFGGASQGAGEVVMGGMYDPDAYMKSKLKGGK